MIIISLIEKFFKLSLFLINRWTLFRFMVGLSILNINSSLFHFVEKIIHLHIFLDYFIKHLFRVFIIFKLFWWATRFRIYDHWLLLVNSLGCNTSFIFYFLFLLFFINNRFLHSKWMNLLFKMRLNLRAIFNIICYVLPLFITN